MRNSRFKFRAWDFRVMSYSPIVSDETDGGETAKVCLNHALFIHDGVIMQYTGLKDKNGDGLTEVYEGDIISIDGTLKGNIYENDKEPTDIVIPQLGTKAWADAYKEAVDRGYDYSE